MPVSDVRMQSLYSKKPAKHPNQDYSRPIYYIKMIECILSDHQFSEGCRQIWGLPALE